MFNITHGENEPLRSYLDRACQEHLNIDIPTTLIAFRVGLKEGPFFEDVEWKIFKIMDDVKVRDEADIRTEDFKNAVSRMFKGHTTQSNEKIEAKRSS